MICYTIPTNPLIQNPKSIFRSTLFNISRSFPPCPNSLNSFIRRVVFLLPFHRHRPSIQHHQPLIHHTRLQPTLSKLLVQLPSSWLGVSSRTSFALYVFPWLWSLEDIAHFSIQDPTQLPVESIEELKLQKGMDKGNKAKKCS
ncbi:hypothetical protein L1987_85356 [Smallanthus sonchifolius]|uniref:Uncharacterized protein n=1 Tax=Smallanthus sonchifolius TaxID=185202 RepID=A0ACB8XWX9_9ASTR|nr:hypothetical protein L1987_85356 [Smallanthus sonchifolius]